MKKLLASLSLVLLLAAPALAQTGGYTGPGADGRQVSVSELNNLNDDTMVRLTGHIETKTGDEKYRFNDGTGTVILEIDDDMWKNTTVGPNEKVEIRGEVDKSLLSDLKVDVKRIVKLNQATGQPEPASFNNMNKDMKTTK